MLASAQIHICDVCRLLDYDTSQKLCGFCGLCDAWICADDMNKWDRRFKAWYRRKTEGGYSGVPNYEELAKGGQSESTAVNGAVPGSKPTATRN